jgi:hypothetical protein
LKDLFRIRFGAYPLPVAQPAAADERRSLAA